MSENRHLPLSQKQLNTHSECVDSPLLEINQNITNNITLPFHPNHKRQSYLQKKALYSKIQKGQI